MVLLWFLRVCVVWTYLELEILLPQPSQVFHLIHPLVCFTESSAYWKHWRQCDYVHSCWTTLIRGESDRSFFSFCVTTRLSWLPRSIPSWCRGTCDSCLCVCLLLCFVFVLWTVEYQLNVRCSCCTGQSKKKGHSRLCGSREEQFWRAEPQTLCRSTLMMVTQRWFYGQKFLIPKPPELTHFLKESIILLQLQSLLCTVCKVLQVCQDSLVAKVMQRL